MLSSSSQRLERYRTYMPKLLIMRGLPGSGKSTHAKKLVDSGNYIRVNRDLLREMLHNNKWSGKNEGLTVDAERLIFALAISSNKNVVVDDTNLNPSVEKMWRDAAKEYGVPCEVLTLTTSLEECIKRDAERGHTIGRDRIVGMALQWNLFPVPDKGIVLCDLDGTLCDIKHRLRYVDGSMGEKKDWKSFFQEIPNDTIRQDVLDHLRAAISEGRKVFFVSARPDTYHGVTETWLRENLPTGFKYEGLIMRSAYDKREDTVVKQDMYDKYFKHYPIELVIDDRPSVIEMWRSNKLTVLDVGDGIPF